MVLLFIATPPLSLRACVDGQRSDAGPALPGNSDPRADLSLVRNSQMT